MIIIVGTSHSIQTVDLELEAYLVNLCKEFKVFAVAEEMNRDALAERDCSTSIPMQVANALQLPHRLCDPNREQRAKLEIRQENDIRMQAWRTDSELSEPEIAELVAESLAKRERYWLEQLRDFNVWPVLFVCGADHVPSFCQLLKQQGISVHVAAEDWTSNNTARDVPQAVHSSL